MTRVIHTAQALVDVTIEVPALPRRGGNVMARSQTSYAGGAVTTLLAAARSGAPCVHAGSVGTGPHGDLIRSVLGAEGITVSSPVVPTRDTGTCVVLVEPSAERTFVTVRGAERDISIASLGTCQPAPGDLVCVSGYSLLAPTRDPLVGWLETLPAGVLVVFDPGAVFGDLDQSVQQRMVELTDVWTSNAEEAAALSEQSRPHDSVEAVSARLSPGAVTIVRDGPQGCVVRVGSRTESLPGYPQKAVDTNGAGDTHTGVLVAERALGSSWPEAARRANAAGALRVTRRGPTSAPTRAEIDDFLARVEQGPRLAASVPE